jgi:hypothetical protein
MHIQQKLFFNNLWQPVYSADFFDNLKANLVLVFGAPELLNTNEIYKDLSYTYPSADIVFCSTAGEISGSQAYDQSVAVTAIEFEKTNIISVSTNITNHSNSYDTGFFLRSALEDEQLKFVFVISDGTLINGSELVNGLNAANKTAILITGGLAGDGSRFEQTFTSLNAPASKGNVIAIGFYGNHIQLGHGSLGGWDEFGPQKTITKSDKNVLYEIDNKSALDLYKEYLGPFKEELPGSALLFPLSINDGTIDKKVVRTILNIDEEKKSMTFAGNMPQGSKVRLMKANFDKLIDASAIAAQYTLDTIDNNPDLAILISCIGRKLVLQDRISEEVATARDILGTNVALTGFYSYGEISPLQNLAEGCELHNQTMTITAIKEI